MTSEKIKDIRKILGVTQKELAVILGVTKTTIARYEMQGGPKPQGDVERKLAQLYAIISDPIQEEQIKNILVNGGIACIAGILSIGAATFPVSVATVRGITLGAILASPAAVFLGWFISKKGERHV